MSLFILILFFFCFKQKTAYEMRISDWSSDVCSSDLGGRLKLDPDVRRLLDDDVLLRQRLLEGIEDQVGLEPAGARLLAQGRKAHLQHVDPGQRPADDAGLRRGDRKSTRLNSSH